MAEPTPSSGSPNLTIDTSSSETEAVAASPSAAASSSGSGTVGDVVLPVKPARRPAQPGDTCSRYSNGQRRSCYDCLNQPLLDGTTCVLNDYGKCDVKKVSLERKGIDYFTSGKDHYCKGTDPACRQCLINGAADSPVCRGADGCVCLAWCFHELPTSPSTTPTPYPTLPDNYESYFKKKNANKSSSLPYMMTSIFILCGIIMYGMHRLRRFRRVNESPPANASNSSQPPHSTRPSRPIRPARPAQPNELRLTGWQKMRKSLIDHEHAALGIDQAAPAQGRVIRTTSVPVAYGERAHPQEQSTRAAL